jgi:DUF1680 family protein
LLDGSYYGCCAAIGSAGFGGTTLHSAIENDGELIISFYEQGKLEFKNTTITLNTLYPLNGKIELSFVNNLKTKFAILLRVPSWCKDYKVFINESQIGSSLNNGYIRLENSWEKGDRVRLELAMPFVIHSSTAFDPEVDEYFAIQKGPIVYATEDCNTTLDENNLTFLEQNNSNANSTYQATDKGGNSITIMDYSSCGKTWENNLSVWLKKS